MKKKVGLIPLAVIILVPLLLTTIFVVVVDPFFHYHKGFDNMSYLLSEERYQNYGIVRHFDYDAIITGSSETQNFKTSDFDSLWGTNAVKTSFPGGSFKEVDELIRAALEANHNVRYVLRSLDVNMINTDKDNKNYEDYPYYLYDKNPFNDYKYIFNKAVILKGLNVLARTAKGVPMTSFDDYGSFYQFNEFGKEAVFRTFERLEISTEEASHLTQEERETIIANINQNIIETARNNKNTTFYYFIPPFCACYFDGLIRSNQYDIMEETVELAVSLLVEEENIRVYSYSDLIDITSNLDNYMDTMHYSEVISTSLLEMMRSDEGLLTKDNYKERFAKEREIYESYDFTLIFGEE